MKDYSKESESTSADRISRRVSDLERLGATIEYPFKPGDYGPDRPPIVYRSGELVTTREFASIVHRILESWFGECAKPEPLVGDHDAVLIPVDRDSLALARAIKRLAGTQGVPADIPVGPHHVFTPAQRPQIGPGSDPAPATAPADKGPVVKTDARVGVVDTGVWRKPPNQLAAQSVADSDEEVPDGDADGVADHYGTGHGGFIAGVIEANAPGIEVMSENAFGATGLTEASVIAQVDECLDKHGIAVLNLSLGSYEVDEEGFDADLVALRAAMRRWNNKYPEALIVAAAGNDATTARFYPAGYADDPEFPGFVVSVGALGSKDGAGVHSGAAGFSNHGPWVNAWAPGVDVVSAYPKGLTFEHKNALGNTIGADTFSDGLAYWSGTSFAAPFVAAEIIREMRKGESPRDTWKRIRGASPFVIFWPSW